MEIPAIISDEKKLAFREAASAMGLDPDNQWVGGYVDYEWNHLRRIIESYQLSFEGINVLEFGHNVGASAIVFRLLGAKVWGVEISSDFVNLARLNSAQYGLDDIIYLHVEDTKTMPFEPGFFDFVNCNSVLEYVSKNDLNYVQSEIDRVLNTDGHILVTGTSNRLWPREVHSKKWFTNYLPRKLDQVIGLDIERGITPWSVRYGFGKHYRNIDVEDGSKAFRDARIKIGMDKTVASTICKAANIIRVGPGMLLPNISCLLKKYS